MVINTNKSESLRAAYSLDIEQLDYKFIRDCNKVKTVENILKVLRSGQEGVYPDLVGFTEERLRTLKPSSSLLRTEHPATTLRALDSEDRECILSDLKKWKDEVAEADTNLKTKTIVSDDQLPPVRGALRLSTAASGVRGSAPQQRPARIPSYDYTAWDHYDVEAQLKLLDDQEDAAAPEPPPEHSDPAIDCQPPVEGLSAAECSSLALRERHKGNEYYRSGDFNRAAVYYTRSINASPTVEAFNNRAQANLKLGKYGSALLDCSAVLRREPHNVKALLRRGIARQMNRDWLKARADFQQVLQIEANNAQARQHLDEVDRAIIGSETKRSKVLIQEVDSIAGENAETQAAESGGIDDQSISDVPDRGSSYQDTATDVDASDTQKERKAPEGENNKLESQYARSKADASENPSDPGTRSNCNTSEEVTSDTSCNNWRAKKHNTSEKAACVPSEGAAVGVEQQGTPPTVSQSPSANAFPGSSATASNITPQAERQDAPIGGTSQSPPSLEPAEDCDLDGAAASRPWSTAEFLWRWRSARRSSSSLRAAVALLRSVAPQQLPTVLGSELDPDILSTALLCVERVMLTEDGPERCRLLLERLTDAQRFGAVKLLLDEGDRQRLKTIVERLEQLGADTSLLTRRFLR